MSGRCGRRIRKFNDVDNNAMLAAINAVLTKNFSICVAAEEYGVSVDMLQRRLNRKKDNSTRPNFTRRLPNRHTMSQLFTCREENILEEQLLKIAKEQPLTMTCVRQLAYEYALKIPKCKYPKKWDVMQMAGINWTYSYRSRHPKINIILGCTAQSKGSGRAESRPDSEETPVLISDIFEGKAMIIRVYHYLEKEYEYIKFFNKDDVDLSPLANILKRTAAATGVSEQTIKALLEEQQPTADPLKQERQEEHCNSVNNGAMSDTNEHEYEKQEPIKVVLENTTAQPLEDELSEEHEESEYVSEPTTDEPADPCTVIKRPRRKIYSPALLNAALQAIKEGATVYEISKLYGIPATTLRNKRDKKYVNHRSGAPAALNTDEEKYLVEWILLLGDAGFRVTKNYLLATIAKYVKDLKRPNHFKNGIPGRMWFRKFMYRHPVISELVINKYKPCQLTEQAVSVWFCQLEQYFKQNNLLSVVKDPSRIFSCDEIGLVLNPSGKQVLIRKGSNESVQRQAEDGKDFSAVVVNVSADGSVLPSMVIYAYSSKSSDPVVPKGWRVTSSESGWLDTKTFSQYIIECFHPWLVHHQAKFPVIVFLDGCVDYISPTLLKFCQEKGIVLIGLLPNTAQALQPLEAAVFRPVEQDWKILVRNFNCQNNCPLTRIDFANQVKMCLDQCVTSRTIEIGFRTSGLYPFGLNNVNCSSLLLNNRNKTNNPYCE